MLITIALLWVVIKMQAPLWVYVCVIGQLVLLVISTVLDIIKRILKRKNEKLKKELSESLHKVGFEKSEADEFICKIIETLEESENK